jgi:hypothetical protein
LVATNRVPAAAAKNTRTVADGSPDENKVSCIAWLDGGVTLGE